MKLFRAAITMTAFSALTACAAHRPAIPAAIAAQQAPSLRPKNVILFVGDGMGISTITAARIYDGQSRGETGEENLLSFEHFPNVALVKTYNTNQQVPDSAGTATAINTGVKTRAGVIGIGPSAHRGNCLEAQKAVIPNIAQRAHVAGKAVGIVSTMRLTHATPAAVCVCVCGAKGGKRLDNDSDLVADWQKRTGGSFVTSRNELTAVQTSIGPLLGLFSKNHMSYMLERETDTSEPTLSEMTEAAIVKVSQDPDGYFLMIEGGNIDHGHHEGRANIALSETQEFARAVQVALNNADLSDTLILVTADHSHVFTIAGYTMRGNPILGLAMGVDSSGEPTHEPILAADGKPYTTLGYQNGPGAVQAWPRPAPSGEPEQKQQALVPTSNIFGDGQRLSETHGGEDVALYATGPGSEMAHGVIEQNRIFDIIVRAFGLLR